MDKIISNICIELNLLHDAVLATTADDRTMLDIHPWNSPPLTRFDLAAIPKLLEKKLIAADIDALDEGLARQLEKFPEKIQSLKNSVLPHLFNGNGGVATSIFLNTLETLENILKPAIGWHHLSDSKAMPAPLSKRLLSLQSQINALIFDKEKLESQLRLINDATEAAESLPTDLERLKLANQYLNNLNIESKKSTDDILDNYHASEGLKKRLVEFEAQAEKIVLQCEEAYRAATTKGLAGAFDQRATSLARSMWIWVFGLLGSLFIGAWIGSERLSHLSLLMQATDPKWSIISMHVFLAILSLGGPLWFAWLATKQIGQRFRLSEDYAFKASVAKAYEGYRKEAARLDESFEARLFASALTRLEEAPLRLVEDALHGSPWHELVSSTGFQNAVNNVPEFRDKLIDILKEALSTLKKQENKTINEKNVPVDNGDEK